MKKIFLVLLVIGLAFSINAQSYKVLSNGSISDTLVTSATFSETFKVVAKSVPTVSVQVSVDSISGTPSGTATLYQSLDNINWSTTGIAVTFTTGVDTSFYLTDTLFYGVYGKVAIVGTATAQRSQIKTIKKDWQKP